MTALLEVRGLRAGYGETAVLHGIDFDVTAGGVTALLGANGAGKTTTLRALCAMARAAGSVRFAGEEIAGRSTEAIVRLGIAHVPDGRGTFATLTVDDNLRLGAIARPGLTRSARRAIADDVERCFSHFPVLRERRAQQAGTLSGGQQQMLAIARALMLRPRLMLLDEPSFGLAPLVVEQVFDILARLNREEGLSILVVEQNAALALERADRAYLLETGRIVFSGAPDDIRDDASLRRAYLGY